MRLRAGSARALLRSRVGARARETSRTLESRGVTAPPNEEARCACVLAARARHGQVEAAHAPARHTCSRAPDAPPRRRPAGDGYAARGRCGAAQPSCAARRQACARAAGRNARRAPPFGARARAGAVGTNARRSAFRSAHAPDSEVKTESKGAAERGFRPAAPRVRPRRTRGAGRPRGTRGAGGAPARNAGARVPRVFECVRSFG